MHTIPPTHQRLLRHFLPLSLFHNFIIVPCASDASVSGDGLEWEINRRDCRERNLRTKYTRERRNYTFGTLLCLSHSLYSVSMNTFCLEFRCSPISSFFSRDYSWRNISPTPGLSFWLAKRYRRSSDAGRPTPIGR